MLDLFELRDLCHANSLSVVLSNGDVIIRAERATGEVLTKRFDEQVLKKQLTTAAESTMNELSVLAQIMSEMTR